MKLLILWFVFGLPAQTIAHSMLEQGDEEFRHRATKERATRALSIYEDLRRASPEDDAIGWRVSMACHFVGMRYTDAHRDRLEIYKRGIRAGQDSIAMNPECAPCHFWTAVNIALYGQENGVLSSLAKLPEVQRRLESTIQLDPSYASGGAFRILGKIYETLPGLFGGSNEKAKELYEKALRIAPQEPLNYLFLVRFYQSIESNEWIAVAKNATRLKEPSVEYVESRESLQELKQIAATS